VVFNVHVLLVLFGFSNKQTTNQHSKVNIIIMYASLHIEYFIMIMVITQLLSYKTAFFCFSSSVVCWCQCSGNRTRTDATYRNIQ